MCTGTPIDYDYTALITAVTTLSHTFPISLIQWLVDFFTQLITITQTPPQIVVSSQMVGGLSVDLMSWLSSDSWVAIMEVFRWFFSLFFTVGFFRSIVMRYI